MIIFVYRIDKALPGQPLGPSENGRKDILCLDSPVGVLENSLAGSNLSGINFSGVTHWVLSKQNAYKLKTTSVLPGIIMPSSNLSSSLVL